MRLEIRKILVCSKGSTDSSSASSKYLVTTDRAPLLKPQEIKWQCGDLLAKFVIQCRDKKK